MTEDIIGRECKFVVHIPAKGYDGTDVHLVKEQLHLADGTIRPNLRFIKDFKRPFYIVKPNKRNYEQKKEYEPIDNLLMKSVTQSKLRDEIARSLDKQWCRDPIRQLCASPYVYGADIPSTSFIKRLYDQKFPNHVSNYSVATFDIETDVLFGTNEIIIASVVFKNQVFTSVTKDFVKGIAQVDTLFHSMVDKYIGDYITKRNATVKLHIADHPVDMIRAVFNQIHEWKPDLLAIWNMDFDIPRVIELLEKYNVDPADIFCDPIVPKEYRLFKYKQGRKKKITASGKVVPINPANQWHTLYCSASYYVIDAMCVYRQIRLAQQEEPSYSLDAILNKELGIRKLKFTEADGYTGLKWHQVMQSNYKPQYLVYNIFDCISMLELDDKIKDLTSTLPSFSKTTDFSRFNSQPTRIAGALYWFAEAKGLILGSVGSTGQEEEDDEDETLGLKGWIITLPAHMSVPGMACIQEDETIHTNLRCFAFDADATAAYPSATSVCNVSKATTVRELIDVDGIESDTFRMQNINLLLGHTNAMDYAITMFGLMKPEDLLEQFKNAS